MAPLAPGLLSTTTVIASLPRSLAAHPAPSSLGQIEWSALVATCVLATPAIALVRAAMPDASAWIVAVLGLAVAAASIGVVVWLASLRSMEPAAIERRRVLGPPLVLALLVVLFSLTGAFHWEAPQTIEQWQASR